MFRKKPQIKTLSPLRSSDRRRIADQIIKDCELEPHNAEGEDAEAKAAATAAHTALRNSLLPENVLSAKFVTTHGPQLKQITGTVYVGSHGSSEQRILWVKIDEQLYPTVYSLWRNPGILPLLHTPLVVIQKLQGGADLMTPGLAGPPFPVKASQGALVAIASLEHPTVPVAVGTCEIDIGALQVTRGVKGHAVSTFHSAGDELWDWSTSGKAGASPPDAIEGWETEEFAAFSARFGGMQVEEKEDTDTDGGVLLPKSEKAAELGSHVSQKTQNVKGESAVVEEVDSNSQELTTVEIDKAFHSAFLFAVHRQKETGTAPKYNLNFPLSQSTFISAMVLPFLPAHTSKQAEQLVIKKTSWKNVRKFIKSLEKEKLLLCREKPGNEVDVWDIDFDDRAFTEFVPHRLNKPASSGTPTESQESEHAQSSTDESLGQQLQRIELFKVKESLSPLFKSTALNIKAFHSAAELRTLLASYIETSSLAQTNNRRLVNLDPFLSNTLFNSTSSPDAEALARGAAPRDALVDRLLASCSPYHAILRNGESLETVKPRAGAAPPITVTVETRGGNKKVTRMSGLEAYRVGSQALADELRKTCAGSAGTEPAKGGKGIEVTVQGPQSRAVLEALEKRGVKAQWVDVVDKTKKK